MIAIDDGIVGGNLTAADVFFLLAAILGLIAALLAALRHPSSVYAAAAGWLAVAFIAFAWFLL